MRPDAFFSSHTKDLRIEATSVADLLDQYGSPLYLYSASAFRQQAQAYLGAVNHRKGAVCFAVKACSNIFVLKQLHALGLGMDIVSGGELYRCKRAGIPGNRIVFSGVGKTRSEITEALQYGVHSLNIESLAEVELIQSIAEKLGKRVHVSFRFNPDVDPKTHPYISTGLRDDKFGLPEHELFDAIAYAQKCRNLELHGLSIHIGSQILTPSPLEEAFEKLATIAHRVEHLLGRPLAFLDCGGGVGTPYRPDEVGFSIQTYIDAAYRILGEERSLFFEPGRSIAANSGALATRVLSHKRTGDRNFLIVDAAMNDLIRPALYESYHEILAPSGDTGLKSRYDVVGPVCESGDFFALSRELPRDLPVLSPLLILSAGAYGFSMSSHYNSRPRCAEVWVDGSSHRLIRARETYEDLTRGELL